MATVCSVDPFRPVQALHSPAPTHAWFLNHCAKSALTMWKGAGRRLTWEVDHRADMS